MSEENLKIRVRFTGDDTLPAAEWMWARPVDAHDGGGIYELLNTSFYVPLAVRDLVRAEPDGDGMMQVTGIACPGPFVMSWAVCASPDRTDAAAVADRWLAQGASWSEAMSGMIATVWDEGVTRQQVERVLGQDLRAGHLTWWWPIEPDERLGDAQETIDFTLEGPSEVAEVTTSYWAPDDPYWREHGLDTPDFLAYVQTLAGEEQLIASALEAGDHEKVREMIAFLNDGPLW
jgi:hypothetical protein